MPVGLPVPFRAAAGRPERRTMGAEEPLKDLATSLKVSLKNASIYHSNHPAFARSVEELKTRIDTLLATEDAIKLGFTSRTVYFDGKPVEEDRTFQELARIFHFRKVKSLTIQRGLSLPELTTFISEFHLPPKDIFKKGGLQNILKKEKISHLGVEELDYSQLLKGEGEEVKDVWTYLLDEALAKQDPRTLDQVAESFENIVGRLEPEDFEQDAELPVNIDKLMRYLKKTQEARFHSCAKVLVKAFSRKKTVAQKPKLEKLRIVFAQIGEEDFASALWEELATDEDFDALSFSIFTRLTEKDKQERIAARLREEARQDERTSTSSELRKKIKKLLSGTSSPYISEIYRQTLSSLLEEIAIQKELTIDRDGAEKNFRFVLLNLFEQETHPDHKKAALAKILEEWPKVQESQDFEFLKRLSEALTKGNGPFYSDALVIKARKLIGDSVERAAIEGLTSPYMDYFLQNLEHSSQGVNIYLQKIFAEGRITPSILQFFFKFFPDQMPYFLLNLEEKSGDHAFLDRMTESLKLVDTPQSLEALKTIFSAGNTFIKIKALRAMQNLSSIDPEFLMPILKKGSPPLKKEALLALVKHESAKKPALDALLAFPSPFGMKNRRLRQHIRIVEEARVKEARDHLKELSLRKDLWNRRLRREARRVLEKWNARSD